MKLLILGGTQFVGRHVVEAALARGHDVAILNRGRTDAGDWPALARVERLVGDRDGDLSALRGRRIDAIVDCTAFTAAQARRTLEALSPSLTSGEGARGLHYVLVSSISAYASFAPGVDFDEDAPLAPGEGAYGPDKARTEDAFRAGLGERLSVVRPGLVVGPFDPTGRFTYWPRRLAKGGRVLAPGDPQREVHMIDARDLAAFCVHLAEARTAGSFNAVRPWITMDALLQACREAAGATRADAPIAWVSEADLLAANVVPWTGLPLWIPASDGAFGGMMRARNDRGVAAGLGARPMADTIADTLAWARSAEAREPKLVVTLSPEREAELLATLPVTRET